MQVIIQVLINFNFLFMFADLNETEEVDLQSRDGHYDENTTASSNNRE